MTTSCCEIKLTNLVGRFSTRPVGALARAQLLELLSAHRCVVVDMQGVRLTPSFADECFGLIAEELGREKIKESLKLTNLGPDSRSLLAHVIARRAPEKRTAA